MDFQKRSRQSLFICIIKSEWAQVHLPKELESNSAVLFQNDKFYTRSEAVLLILGQLPEYNGLESLGICLHGH